MEPPDFLHLADAGGVEVEAKDSPAFGLPLRRWRPPWPLEVKVSRRCPINVCCVLVSGQVCAARGPYQLAGGWWEKGASWNCEEWDVELAGGGIYRVSRQGANWFLEGVYD